MVVSSELTTNSIANQNVLRNGSASASVALTGIQFVQFLLFLIDFDRGSEKCAIALTVNTYEIYKEMRVNFKQKWFTRF